MGEYDAAPVRLCVIDGTKWDKVCKSSWANIRQNIREGVSKSCATQRGCNCESAELNGIVPKCGSRGIENLITQVTGYPKKHPGGTPEVLHLDL